MIKRYEVWVLNGRNKRVRCLYETDSAAWAFKKARQWNYYHRHGVVVFDTVTGRKSDAVSFTRIEEGRRAAW